MRMSFSVKSYNMGGEDKCWGMWHTEVPRGPYCALDLDHQGDHRGFGMHWPKPSEVDGETAEKFFQCYRSIPNHDHDIVLRDDGTVEMTLGAFWAATVFIDLTHNGQ